MQVVEPYYEGAERTTLFDNTKLQRRRFREQ